MDGILLIVSEEGDLEVFSSLIENGANIYAGNIAFVRLIVRHNHLCLVKYLLNMASVRDCYYYDADKVLRYFILCQDCKYGRVEVIKCLFDEDIFFPYCFSGYIEMIRLLVSISIVT